MANYNCTPIGCIQNNSGSYPDLQSCQSVCFKWGCPEQLSADTKLYFIYDASGSYGPDIVPMFTAATAYTTTLQANGWQGDAYHILTANESWLHWPTAVYKHDLVRNGELANPPFGQTNCWDITGLPDAYAREFHIFDVDNDNIMSWSTNILQSSNGFPGPVCYCPGHPTEIVGGGVKKAEYDEHIIVVTIIDQSHSIEGPGFGVYEQGFECPGGTIGTNYGQTPTGYMPMTQYAAGYMWHYITMSAVTANGGSLKSVMLPRQSTAFGATGNWHEALGWEPKERKFAMGITAAIDSGNQDITAAGGTGTLDGTWITQTGPGSISGPNSICAIGMTQDTDPTIYGSYTYGGVTGVEIENPYWSTPTAQYFPFYSNMGGGDGPDPLCAFWGGGLCTGSAWPVDPNTGVAFTESPTGIWGGLDQLGWVYDISFSGANATDFGAVLDNLVGTYTNPLITCVSAETSGTLDYPHSTAVACESICFPQNITSYECGAFGCYSVPGNSGSFINLSACTASCTSYTCTMTGCTLEEGTGGTATLTACTGTCIHFECTELCGCVETPGYGNLSLDYVYSTLNQCREACIGYKCYNDLGIQADTKVYVYYDGTSMGLSKVQKAYWGLQSYLNSLPGWNGYQQHQMGISESWLGWSTAPYGPVAPWTGQLNLPAGGGAFASALPTNMNHYIPQALKWATGVHDSTGGNWAQGYPNLSHWTTFQSAPGTPPENFVGQPTLDGYTNNNASNPNGGMGQDIHLTYWGQRATPGDDVVVIVFADESDPNYYISYSTFPNWGGAPRPIWKNHYSNYVGMWEWLEGNCSGSTIYSAQTRDIPYRAFLYPTTPTTVSGKRANFALHGLAAISVGNLLNTGTTTPFTGLWSAGTAPRSSGVGNWDANNSMDSPGSPGYCPVNLNSLETANPYMSTVNSTTSARFYSASTATTMSGISLNWGGLETMGWGINTRFPVYNVTTFTNDLTQFLSGSTTQMTGVTCISAETLCGAGNLFPHCELTACTATCVNYDCSPNGCIVNVSNGQYPNLPSCTAACQSYTCTTTGCSVYNVPYVAANGIIDYATSYGSGGTYFNTTNSTAAGVYDSQLSCVTNCQKFICDDFGCQGEPGIAGYGEYSSLPDCISACTSFNCDTTYVNQTTGQPYFTGTIAHCNPIPNSSGNFTDVNDCQTGCTSYECGDIGCYQSNNQFGYYGSLSSCTAQCQSTECTNGGCVDQIGSGGTFFNLASFALATASCVTTCISYNCGPSGCTTQVGTGGTYSTSASCTSTCSSYNCDSQGCLQQAGSGGTYFNETSLADAFTACTAQCNSWECGTFGCYEDPTGTGGTYSSLTQCQEVCTSWDCGPDGCGLFNQPPNPPNANLYYYGTGGQYATSGACSAACISFDCVPATSSTVSGCIELEGSGHTYPNYYDCTGTCKTYTCSVNGCIIQPNSGGTYPFTPLGLLQCQTACTSYDCGTNDCTPVVGSGGTYWNVTNSYLGYTTCTASCSSYNCYSTGCTLQIGTGGTFSAMSSCTASCTSWECTQDCCQLFNSPYYGTGGTYTTSGNCHTDCVNWGCFPVNTGITLTTSKIYAYYDTTSMSQDALKDAILGMNAWVATLPGFLGNLYHTLVNDERWIGWATSVYTGAFADGNTSSVIDNSNAGLIYQWAANQVPAIDSNIYDNCIPGTQFPFLIPVVLAKGPAPTAANTDDVIVVAFIDESAEPNFGPLASPSITQYVYHGDDVGCGVPGCINPQYAGLIANPLHDQPTETWKQDYTAFTTSYNAATAATGTFNALMYPTNGSSLFGSPVTDKNRVFALHAVAAISKGNMTVGLQGENYWPGTAPRTAASGGLSVGVPNLCAIADLTALEVSNPYVLQGYGNLRDKGWNYNIGFSAYTDNGFSVDMEDFLTHTTTSAPTGGTQCLSACTPTSKMYPYTTLEECTGGCASYECTITGCIVSPNTGGTFSSLAACTASCISWSCTTTGTTSIPGTGATGTHTDYNVVASGCNSFNCVYDPSGPTSQQGCQQQIGSGGTYETFSACTADCRSWECITNCLTNATGCTEHPNTGHTYNTFTACTGSCTVDWYCVPETMINSCSGQQIIGPAGIINNGMQPWTPQYVSSGYGFLGYMGTPVGATNHQYDTWSTFSFSMTEAALNSYGIQVFNALGQTTFCEGPDIVLDLGMTHIPGYLVTLESIQWGCSNCGGNFNPWGFPIDYYDWATMIADFISMGANVNLSMQPHAVFAEIQGTFAASLTQQGAAGVVLDWAPTFTPCICLPDPCYTVCDNGTNPIPPTAIGPFTTSGAAENACCFTATTWNCSAGTILDTCSGRTQIDFPNQFANSIDAWDWLTVNSPASVLDTLKYESTTPAFGIDDVCVGPNGGILYEILPMSSPYVNSNVSYATWDGFVAQLQSGGLTGIYSGMSYTIVNSHFMAQSGHSLSTCVSQCTCREADCHCVEVIGTGGTYATSGLCYSACCSGVTGTSWNCVSGQSFFPICSAKTDMGILNSPWAVLDNFRVNAPSSYFASKKYASIYDQLGTLNTFYTWNEVWTHMSASTHSWAECYVSASTYIGWPINQSFGGFIKRAYVEYIAHPLVTGGFQYHTWNDFYNAASSVVTLNTGMSVSGVCDALGGGRGGGELPGWGSYGCKIGTKECCSRRDCYCYELFTTGGTYTTEPDCISACCPTTGWTCYSANSTPQGICINVINPQGMWWSSQSTCEDPLLNPYCFPVTSWQCVTGITMNSCDPSIDLYGNSPAIASNNIQYPFTSTTIDLNGPPTIIPPNNLVSLYGVGQVETILTNHLYMDPNTPFSAVTFEYCSGSTASCTGTTNCFGHGNNQIYGPNSYPTYRMISISHSLVYNWLPFNSWTSFITAAQGLGHAITTGMTANFLHDNTIFFHNTFITVLEPCTCYFDAKACDCIEVQNNLYFPTSAACEAVCCPSGTPITYDCTINGCVDPGNGLGDYTLSQYNDCVAECQEWICVTANTVLDSCVELTANNLVIPPGANSTVGALLPQYSNSWPYMQTKYDALNYFGDIANGLQGANFGGYKWDCTVGCGSGWGSIPSCLAPYGVWARLVSCSIQTITNPPTVMYNGPYTNWTSMLTDLNANGYTVNSAMDLQQIITSLDGEMYELMPVWEPCMCAETDCGCVLTGGTGHTSGYSLTQSALCESICCSAVCVDECGVLICGEAEGVLYYDHVANITVKLFDDAMYQYYDIAARQNKIWLYNYGTIHEWDVTWCPFTKVFNRAIGVGPGIMGKGLTPTNSPYKLLTAFDKVYELDISGGAAVSTPLYNIPSGLTCTGDIIWDEANGGNPAHTIITYGSGSTYYVGKFTHPAGVLLEYSQITGLNAGESMDSLYGVNDSSTQIFGITTDRRVFELMTNVQPLEFAPAPTQTLTLHNQVTNKVHGATNVSFGGGPFQHSCTKIESNDSWYCMDIVGCQSFTSAPSSYEAGPFTFLVTCEAHCNWGCNCVQAGASTPCLCELTTSPVTTPCNWYSSLGACELAQPPVGVIQPGKLGCCDCYGCTDLHYFTWAPGIPPVLQSAYITTNTVAGNVNTWVFGQSYWPGDVVLYTDPYGHKCCYVRVVDYCAPPCGFDSITPWDSNQTYVNSISLNQYVTADKMPWIACDRDCPTVITYDCVSAHSTTWSATTSSEYGCAGRINFIPYQISNAVTSPLSFYEWVSTPSNGMQYIDFNTMRYVTTSVATTPWQLENYCFDIQDVMTPNGLNYWSIKLWIQWDLVTGVGVQFSKWSDFIAAIQTSSHPSGPFPTVTMSMTNLQMRAEIASIAGYVPNGQTGTESVCPCKNWDCHCEEVIGSGGDYVTSAACEYECCSGSTWSCDTTNFVAATDSCAGSIDTGAQAFGPIPQMYTVQIDEIAAMGAIAWNTDLSTYKFQMGMSPIPGAVVGAYQGQQLIPLAFGDASCPSPMPGSWARILEVASSVYPYDIMGGGYTGGPPYTQWHWFIQALNDNAITYGTGHVFNDSMTWAQVRDMAPHIECKWEMCVCTTKDCRGNCIELFDGSGNHSTQDDCLSACCPTYDCTPTGCINPGTGLGSFTGLSACEVICQQYECKSGSTIQSPPCSTLTQIALGQGSNFMGAGSQYDVLAYFAEPTTPPIAPEVNNMQGATFSNYKSVLQGIVPPFTQFCEVTFDLGWPFNQNYLLGYEGYLTHVDLKVANTGVVVAGPFTDWASIIQYLNVNLGMTVSLSWTFQQVQDMLINNPDSMVLEPFVQWCECSKKGCDCVLIPGTGTTPWDIYQYLPCYSACCEETYDCKVNGCQPNNTGTGLFTSLAQCQIVCVEWECISAVTAVNCEMKASIPVMNCQPLPNGYGTLVNNLLDYFSNPANSLTWTSFNMTKYDQSAPVIYNPNTPNCNSYCNTGVWHYFDTISMSNDLSPTHPYYINTGPCNSWGDFINQVNLQPGINNYLMVNYSPNTTAQDILHDVWTIPGNSDTLIRISPFQPCVCVSEDCHCDPLNGTGRTPTQNYYTTSAACSADCCSDEWYCHTGAVPQSIGWPFNTTIGTTQPCTCLQNPPPGVQTFPTELDCKQYPQNCCLPQYYDCPNGYCQSLTPGTVGPYSTAAACAAAVSNGDCAPMDEGWNCKWVEDDAPTPTPAGSFQCLPCVGGGCQYTPATAAGPPYFGNALAQCQYYCEGENGPCIKCCMDDFGAVYSLSLTANPCKCPIGTTEVPAPCKEPCPYPVSCLDGFTYNWSTCECECDQQICAQGWYWDYHDCECKQDVLPSKVKAIDVTREQAEMVVEIAEYYNLPIGFVAQDVSDATDRLETLKTKGFKGEDCIYCTNNIPGVCLYTGCLSLDNTKWLVGSETKILCYLDGLPVYSHVDGAEDIARRLGCSGTHQHQCKDGAMGYMACASQEEAITKFDDIKPEKIISNKDPELYKFIREVNRLKPQAPSKPVVGGPFVIPTTTEGGGDDKKPDSGGGDCCTWCAKGGVGIAPSGCYDWMCTDCYEPDDEPGDESSGDEGREDGKGDYVKP